jgi:hypothetical protein
MSKMRNVHNSNQLKISKGPLDEQATRMLNANRQFRKIEQILLNSLVGLKVLMT